MQDLNCYQMGQDKKTSRYMKKLGHLCPTVFKALQCTTFLLWHSVDFLCQVTLKNCVFD